MQKREVELPVELESQFIMRLPEEPAKALRNVLKTGENFKNRLTIQLDNDMRHGQVRFDHWLLHCKILDLPTIVESLKTIDRKSVYKSADICQIMICKTEPDPATTEEESPAKNKKKDPFKVDKKFLYPHGITPPTKNVRKRRFRKTLKKKSMEAPEIEKEVKRLLRADNEAVSVTWEVIKEESENDNKPETSKPLKAEKGRSKKDIKAELKQPLSKVEDIFGGALSDSDLEDENINVDIEDSARLSSFDDHMSDMSMTGPSDYKAGRYPTQFTSDMFNMSHELQSHMNQFEEIYHPNDNLDSYPGTSKNYSEIEVKLQQLNAELEELRQRKQRTQHEIINMENMTLKQRFQEILQNINKEISSKELEYQSLQMLK